MDVYQPKLLLITLYACLVGLFLGGVYDLIRFGRLTRTVMPSGERRDGGRCETVFLFFEDVFFWLFAALTVILLLFHSNEGKIRWFALVFAAIGFALYRLTVSPFVIRSFVFLISRTKRAALFVKHRLLCPLTRFLLRILTKMLHIIASFLNIFLRIYDNIKLRRETKKAIGRYLAESEAFFERFPP